MAVTSLLSESAAAGGGLSLHAMYSPIPRHGPMPIWQKKLAAASSAGCDVALAA